MPAGEGKGWEIRRNKVRGKVNPVWQLKIAEDGELIRESLRTSDRVLALERAQRRYKEWKQERRDAELGLTRAPSGTGEDLAALVGDYKIVLDQRGRSADHSRATWSKLLRVFEACGASTLDQLDAQGLRQALEGLQVLPKHNQPLESYEPRPLSAGARNRYRAALTGFFRWLMREGRWDLNPAAAIPAWREVPGETWDERRALRPDELAELLRTAPRHRGLIYRVAAQTGKRRRALEELQRADVDLEELVVVFRAAGEKSRRREVLPITEATAAEWRKFFDQGAAYHAGKPTMRTSEREAWARRIAAGRALPPLPGLPTFRRDLHAAGIVVGEGWRLDFHALRATLATHLDTAGVSLRRAQEILGHSDPRITARHYSRVESAGKREAIEAVERLLNTPPPPRKSNIGTNKKRRRGKRA